jgi:hypothetical protein
MRDAADLVRAHGAHLGERQDDLIARLEAPYALGIQRAIRDLLNDGTVPSGTKPASCSYWLITSGWPASPLPSRFRPSTSTTFT